MVGERRKIVFAHHTYQLIRRSFVVAALAFGGAIVFAQEDDQQFTDKDEVIDEIVVIAGGKSGDPVDVDALYLEMMREKFMLDQDHLRAFEEEGGWRSASSVTVKNPSRIQWGYDPHDELRMRREFDFGDDETSFHTRPATVFRIGF